MSRHRFTSLNLMEISSVTKPAQVGAQAKIMKIHDPLADSLTAHIMKVAKDGAKTFAEILQIKEEQERAWKVRSELYLIFDAINDSVSSILGDSALTMAQKSKKVEQSVNDFLSAVRAKFPDVEEEIAKALKSAGLPGLEEGTSNMDIKELEAKVTKLSGDLAASQAALATATAMASLTDDQKAFVAKLGDTDKEAFLKSTPEERAKTVAKAREGDETVEIEGQTIRKSEVGATMFSVLKMQNARIAASEIAVKAAVKASEDAVFKAEASTLFDGYPGTEDEKTNLLRVVSKDSGAKKALEAIVKSANKVRDTVFKEFGHVDETGEVIEGSSTGEAEAQINKLADEIRKSNTGMSFEQAVSKVLDEHPELYAQYDAENKVNAPESGDE